MSGRVGTMSLVTSCDITRHHAIGSGWRKMSFDRRRCGREPRWREWKRFPLQLAHTCRWILILSSLDPLPGMSVIRIVLHNNLIHFGSPASTTFRSAFRSASRPTAVALTASGIAYHQNNNFHLENTFEDWYSYVWRLFPYQTQIQWAGRHVNRVTYVGCC